MSRRRYKITKHAAKDIQSLPQRVQKRIAKKLKYYLQQDDPLRFAAPLKDPADADYRFRIGDYRVLFDVHDDTYVILRVQDRKEVYRK